jgi:cytoskeleton protein RodZ
MPMATFGEKLKREREQRGITLHEVAEATKISVRFLAAIENGRMDVLPGGLFPRSFVRQYASCVGLDAERTVADFLCELGEKTEPAPVLPRPRRLSLRRAASWFLPLGLLLGLVVAREIKASRTQPGPALAPPVVPAAPQSFAADRVFPPPSSPSSPPMAGGALALDLRARESCWVAVEADGVKVLDRVLNPGETRNLSAKSELVLSVGNAGAVELSANGRASVPLGRQGEVRRKIQITKDSLPSLLQETADAAPHG